MEKTEFTPEHGSDDAEKRKKVEVINKLEIGPEQKAQIILVALGLKPATELDLYKHNDNQEVVETALGQSELMFNPKEIASQSKAKERYAIARDEETLKKLSETEATKDHSAYGELMGYPESAIDAFGDEEKLLPKSEYPDMAGIVLSFKLSKDGWREEVEHLREWSEAIKEFAPDLYQKLIGK